MIFFFNDTATTEIYTFPTRRSSDLCTALIVGAPPAGQTALNAIHVPLVVVYATGVLMIDRKSTRLNSSHQIISYAAFCLKKKPGYTHVVSSNPESALSFTLSPRTPF